MFSMTLAHRFLVLSLALCVSSAGRVRAEGREVILVREGAALSKYVYRNKELIEQAAWSRTGRFLAGPHPMQGLASHYGGGDIFTGSKTANGETLDDARLTAAHRTLPIGTWVRVTSELTGRSVVVRVNDRGPFFHDRVIDLSAAAANAIGIRECGLAPVRLTVIPPRR